MTRAPLISVESFSLPLASESEAQVVGESMRAELARLWQADAAGGRTWNAHIETLALDMPADGDPATLGRMLAAELRSQALGGGAR